MDIDKTQYESPFSSQVLDKVFKESIVSLQVNKEQGQTCTLYRVDYQSMLPHKWLRTAPIDYLIKTLLQKELQEICKIYASRGIFNQEEHLQYIKMMDLFVVTMIMTYDDQMILKSLQGLNLFSKLTKYLIIPVNTENANGSHWMLGCFKNGSFGGQKGKSSLVMFDSGQSGTFLGKALKSKLQKLYKVLTNENLQIDLSLGKNVPFQTNNYDCGIFTIGFAQYILKQISNELEEKKEQISLDRLGTNYKYLLGSSTLARQRYRRMIQEKILSQVMK